MGRIHQFVSIVETILLFSTFCGSAQNLTLNDVLIFQSFFRFCIPFHPALLLGNHPLVLLDRVLSFITSTGLIHQI
uniref:Putative secreted protein n=1 Tax=Ixodes ricinus TaxID=34613 RepID=A0A6B0TU42_IXORI